MEEGSTKLPESPRNLRAIAVTNTTATLMWNVEDKSGVDQFEVYYRKLYNNSDNTNIFVSDKVIIFIIIFQPLLIPGQMSLSWIVRKTSKYF